MFVAAVVTYGLSGILIEGMGGCEKLREDKGPVFVLINLLDIITAMSVLLMVLSFWLGIFMWIGTIIER